MYSVRRLSADVNATGGESQYDMVWKTSLYRVGFYGAYLPVVLCHLAYAVELSLARLGAQRLTLQRVQRHLGTPHDLTLNFHIRPCATNLKANPYIRETRSCTPARLLIHVRPTDLLEPQELDVGVLGGQEEGQGLALPPRARRPPHTVDEERRVL